MSACATVQRLLTERRGPRTPDEHHAVEELRQRQQRHRHRGVQLSPYLKVLLRLER